ncbi:hypothetical protein PG994_012539 [Apiospora phragmitis]|uniref:Uncharacterized protein n=1 Tax=Apiospora phragmitis TaxID=2905665 RepID=A0ABR1TYR0_9PEZI
MVNQANDPRWNIGYETEPVPSRLGLEEHYLIQEGFLCYELYCRLFYHGDRGLHFATRCRSQFELFRLGNPTNLFSAIQVVHNIHGNNLLKVLSIEGLPSASLDASGAGPEQWQVDNSHAVSQVSLIGRKTQLPALFDLLRHSVCYQGEPMFSFNTDKYDLVQIFPFHEAHKGISSLFIPRYQFSQPDYEQLHLVSAYLSEDHLIDEYTVYKTRHDWYMGPWFQDWDWLEIGSPMLQLHAHLTVPETKGSPWDEIRRYDQHRSVTRAHEKWKKE